MPDHGSRRYKTLKEFIDENSDELSLDGEFEWLPEPPSDQPVPPDSPTPLPVPASGLKRLLQAHPNDLPMTGEERFVCSDSEQLSVWKSHVYIEYVERDASSIDPPLRHALSRVCELHEDENERIVAYRELSCTDRSLNDDDPKDS